MNTTLCSIAVAFTLRRAGLFLVSAHCGWKTGTVCGVDGGAGIQCIDVMFTDTMGIEFKPISVQGIL